MATTLSPTNVDKPVTGDKGAVFWPALEELFQSFNDHAHTGSDSNRLSAASSQAAVDTTSITGAGSWTSLGSGHYEKVITMPAGLVVDDVHIQVRGAAAPVTDMVLDLSIEKTGASTFKLSTNTPVAMKIFYTT
jgi:predicted secreted protein